jgi:hypothetical protein
MQRRLGKWEFNLFRTRRDSRSLEFSITRWDHSHWNDPLDESIPNTGVSLHIELWWFGVRMDRSWSK